MLVHTAPHGKISKGDRPRVIVKLTAGDGAGASTRPLLLARAEETQRL